MPVTANTPKYTGPPPKSQTSEEQIAALRAKVPDDPIKLPPGHLACEACGIAVDDRRVSSTVAQPSSGHLPPRSAEFTRCSSCEAVRTSAAAYVTAHPAYAARIGPDIAVERVEAVLFGLEIIGQTTSTDLGLLLPRLHPAAHSVRFSNPLTLTIGLCSPRPWAHVTLTQRDELRRAYAAGLRDRLAQSEPPVAIRCPTGGCVFCGLASVNRAAIEVARRGGVEAVSRAVWREVNTNPKALGSRGPERIWGHACPACALAIEDAGAIGWPARAQAVVTYLSHKSPSRAQRLRAEVEGDFPPVLPAWRVIPSPKPSREPWAHLHKVIDRL
ncbi:hypothetical protein [Nocardioides donggukensis]|uniref:Uncharacterized protein n=1 Tax=Nocardioides donggukensis TaxID=2774019 RepID=A0A927KB32_9ACTN|nr:hypothetical protein [Nocardioides donggukensis]MBD8870925.1 hypothetical protein [Nocardioides donggukensis]